MINSLDVAELSGQSLKGPLRRIIPALLLLLALFLAFLLLDFVRFAGRALGYAHIAKSESYRLPRAVTEHEAIVVLTGDHGRIPEAVELLRLRRSPLLIISGTGKGTTLTDLANLQGDTVKNIAEVWDRVVLEPRSSSTVGNAEETGKLLAERAPGVTRIILVTSDYHIWRAAMAFRHYLPQYEYFIYPTPSVIAELPIASIREWVGSAWRLWGEYWKLFFFRIHLWREPSKLPTALPKK